MNNIFNNGNKDNSDYIKRFVEKDTGDVQVYSPMDPPDAYKPQGVEPVPYNELHAMMQALMDEHKITLEKINDFEATLLSIKKDGVNKESNKKLGDFFANG